ncbi:exodeoxyribonuclease VII small subunit [Salinisphaera orenii MK-B5]|uniref:Exodeoxyribonuclease 7 small subunit n=1 Tax=Salinisphaera orenii MK-B5 TaxID=856730 RepID=A0A423PP42_9GAMM|nr:exodeoxyribonuclease VII small subunit [Salinisphaera orenii]ROO27375.1 exodeoxyribonuclease VII small subunit [Salinisphaera orenii MK-B5]
MARKDDTPTPPATEDDAPRLAEFESSVAELEALVEALESGEVSLETALAQFERGVVLARQCQSLLKNAELRVDQLLAEGDEERVADFDAPDTDRD